MISSAMTEILRLLYAEARPQLSDDCAGVLGMDHLAVSLSIAGHATEQLWSSGKTSSLFEDLQFTLGEGPGPDAVRTGLLVLAHDVSAVWAGRWPTLLPAMAHLPIEAMFCLPLSLGGITVGVLTALRSAPGPMTGQEMDDALGLAAALTLQFLGGDGVQLDSWVDEQPNGELHRAVVHQATGMLSVQLNTSLGQALLRLRGYAYSHDRSIIDIAEDIVSRRLRLDADRPESDAPDETKG
ncbi:GAF and ANTAR domain-containing protein [Streptomyces lunaelactis]|uniref:GAF and ANTAR domain-containing protein n=2 Tax=Streptomyces lunaelactis TaxID=1535768 RepID=UPI0015850532|nr:GAF and ANTAR domain-containing protein [Streptomyces lunaelactis]NUK00475.1 GAF and ANTAR domain-containing protein [Streptomyces lunaelactis]NUK15771.1 GAF and ANTAR domain-containing protein [Streptomyces lunaelactis]NUK25814.1 GAF and ANTAR domain-containing protein [Streptomyces lunaelactis]NUK36449.1 GAF and ANTAR domain-containing protein [Streptomyces lunaelactis]NUK59498.1 GAF and ANTAR domain-containing protein [Streptomyces lunaelactis]